MKIVDPQSMPSEWLALDLGAGELAAMALALENRSRVILLDDALARRTAQAAGLVV
jgi:predicted nucleic acid-binding protein